MSIYLRYQECIQSFIQLNKEDWDFKSNDNFVYMLEHVSPVMGDGYLNEIIKKFATIYNDKKDYLIDISHKNDFYGKTKKVCFSDFTTCSPTNLRYILHSFFILSHMRDCSLNEVDVIEIGGGYGGLCFFLHKLCSLFDINLKTYTIFDLPEPLLLQEKYLNALDITNINFKEISNIGELKKNSFLVSTYAFSEISLELQQEYTRLILNDYTSHGFIAWNHIDLYQFIDNKNITSEPEVPLTGDYHNLYVRF